MWLRTLAAATVTVAYGPAGEEPSTTTAPVETSADTNYTAHFLLPNLQPATAYFLRVLVEGYPVATRMFRTVDPNTSEVVLAFISDSFKNEPIPAMPHLAAHHPLAIVGFGDLPHDDPMTNVTTIEQALFKFRQSQLGVYERGDTSNPHGQSFADTVITNGIPVLGWIADDHEIIDNWTRTNQWIPQFLQTWAENRIFPADNGMASGYFYWAARQGPVAVIALDGRTHRDVPGPTHELLGEAQWVWLADLLEVWGVDPTIWWIVLVSADVVNQNQAKLDSWAGYDDEAQRLFDLVAPYSNIVVVTGDCHWGSIVLPPKSPLPEINNPKLNGVGGFANTCNNADSQWTPGLNSAAAGQGFTVLKLRATECDMLMYNDDGTLRMSTTITN